MGHKGRWIRSASLLMEDGAFWMAHMGLFWEIMHFWLTTVLFWWNMELFGWKIGILCSWMKYWLFLVDCGPLCVDMGLLWWNAGLFRRGISVTWVTHCQTATRCNTLQHAATHITELVGSVAPVMTPKNCNTRQQTAPQNCNTLQQTAPQNCNALQYTATHCNTLKHTATHCNTLQQTLPDL